MTNREAAATNPLFRKACELAETAPTRRQMSKWNRCEGVAWRKRNEADRALREEYVAAGVA